jgi:hypothetical protein
MSIVKQVLPAVFLSVIFSSIATYYIATDIMISDRKFRVIDIKQLSKALMVNLQQNISAKGVEMKPEVISVLAQNEAKKMFAAISRSAGKEDIILSKSNIVHSPARYDITEEIASEMGLKELINKDLDSIIAQAGQVK